MPYSKLLSFMGSKISIDHLIKQETNIQKITLDILRLDKIHETVSGNKLFKLSEYLDEALRSDHKTMLTFGGFYSNHFTATAFACNLLGLKSIGIVRGNEAESTSTTITDCRNMGMEIHFLERADFKKISEKTTNEDLIIKFGKHTLVPLGGYGIKGAIGAAHITDFIPENKYTHICVAVGTATTLAGLLLNNRTEKIMAFPALKGLADIYERLYALGVTDTERLVVFPDFHFGGFAKKNPELLNFMNEFYHDHLIPLDFVYTGKMMFGIINLLHQNLFPHDARILAVHTGGLQGNRSLPEGTLCF